LNRRRRIEICGNIASGKTTLARGFAKIGYAAIEETFLRNPFIEKFYQNQSLYSFETEISFLLQHYHSIKSDKRGEALICDFSLCLDNSYADVTLPDHRRNIFLTISDEIIKEIGDPEMIIYLRCPEQVLLDRILKRGRKFETPIDISYLQKLSKAIESRISMISSIVSVVEIDSNQIDFRKNILNIHSLSSITKLLDK